MASDGGDGIVCPFSTLHTKAADNGIGRSSRFLVVAKTLPTPSHTYEETVWCAGIDAETCDWIRMHPVNFRSMAEYARFNMWQFIETTWAPATGDG